MHVLLTGATGFVGRHLLPELRERGHEITALVRDQTTVDLPPDVRVIEGDLQEPATVRVVDPTIEPTTADPPAPAADESTASGGTSATTAGEHAEGRSTSLTDAIADCDAAFYLVHSMRAGEDFERLDRTLAQNFATAASDAGIDRVVYLGGLGGTDDARDLDRDDLSAHLRSRREVESILAEGEYDLTILRAAIVVGAGSAGFEIVRQLATKLPVMVTPSWVRTPCQPIAIGDAVAYLAGVLDAPETAGNTYGIGGPEVLPYEEMLRRVGRILGREPRIVPVPVLSPRLSSYWVGLVTDVDAAIARPLIEGLRTPVVVEDSAIDELVPIEHTPFDEAVRRALGEDPS